METKLFNRIPNATYRLQFNQSFTFKQAQALVPYLKDLGITDIYCSPISKARPGSTHGYDVCNHNELNPEVGTPAEFEALAQELKKANMGLLVDIVPNHMGIAECSNGWWLDILEHGQLSQYAHYFDINWHPLKKDLQGKVLLPILGNQYGIVLEEGHLQLFANEKGLFLKCYDITLPINLKSYGKVLATLPENSAIEDLIKICQELKDSFLDLKELEKNRALITSFKEKWISLYRESPDFKNRLETTLQIINGNPANINSFDVLDALLEEQYYRLSYWKVAGEEINYRRFFDVNDLAAISVQKREVFNEIHQMVAKMIAQQQITGLRIDHIDGLWHPEEYLENVQQLWHQRTETLSERPAQQIYLLVEKILCGNETLPKAWPVAGTTGYEYASRLTGVLIPASAQEVFDQIYEKWRESSDSHADICYQCKINVMHSTLASEINTLGSYLQKIAHKQRRTRDFTLNSLIDVIRQTIACFDVYRTYIVPGSPISQPDEIVIRRAMAQAKNRNRDIEFSTFELLEKILLGQNEFPHTDPNHAYFVMKFQQVTGPVMAKAVEDTAFYIYNRLIALNEVGAEPNKFGFTLEEFHRFNRDKQKTHPHNLITTSTHDTKRSEDVRAQIAALSEFPKEWRSKTLRWNIINQKHKKLVGDKLAPSLNEEYLLYQTLVSTLPFNTSDKIGWNTWVDRMQAYLEKAMKEAKVNTSWMNPNAEWDEAVKNYIQAILDRKNNKSFLKSLIKFVEETRVHGLLKALTQTLFKLTLPGVPDFYQGTEIWDDSLVDPDNRRPVDFSLRSQTLATASEVLWPDLLKNWRNGQIKMALIERLLKVRQRHSDLFTYGSYEPLIIAGENHETVVAYYRQWESLTLVVVALRFSRQGCDSNWQTHWQDLTIQVPNILCHQTWENSLNKNNIRVSDSSFSLASLLGHEPFGVWLVTKKD